MTPAHEGTHLFFDKIYIDDIDAKVRTYSATGARVYLQLLLPSDTQILGAEYALPNIYNDETLSKVYTYVSFLASRYRDYVDGQIGGFIVGTSIDTVKGGANVSIGLETYAQRYAFYLSVVANAARLENPNIDIVIPLSNFNSYRSIGTQPNNGYSPSLLLEKILATLDDFSSAGFNCSTMLESSTVPIGIVEGNTEDDTDKKIFSAISEGENEIGVNNIALYDAFISKLKNTYRSAPKNYIYCWQIPKGLLGIDLECSYAYSYYTLYSNSRVSSFVITFENVGALAVESIGKTIKYIDTAQGEEECSRLLEYFGETSWDEVVKKYSEKGLILRDLYTTDDESIKNTNWLGSFSFFDFSKGDLNGWFGASYSKGVRSDYGEGGQRVLRQTVGKASGGASHSDLLYLYEYDESLIYTPALKFRLGITDGEISAGAVYELTVTLGIDGNSISKSCLVLSGEIADMWIDVSEYSGSNKVGYIKISSRSISGGTDEYSLWLYDIVGYSDAYTSEQLGSLIDAERQSIRDQSKDDDVNNTDNLIYWIVFSIILVAICIGGIIITVVRRDDNGRKAREKINNSK